MPIWFPLRQSSATARALDSLHFDMDDIYLDYEQWPEQAMTVAQVCCNTNQHDSSSPFRLATLYVRAFLYDTRIPLKLPFEIVFKGLREFAFVLASGIGRGRMDQKCSTWRMEFRRNIENRRNR